MRTCGTCGHYIGGGDFNLCCDLPHPDYPCGFLCYEHTEACEQWTPMDCCADCRHQFKLEKLDYSKGGCDHTDMDGYACTVFMDEGVIEWMVGVDANSGLCECFEPKAIKKPKVRKEILNEH